MTVRNPYSQPGCFPELQKLMDSVLSGDCDPEKVARDYPRLLANLRRQANLRPSPVNGDRALGRRMGYFECVLSDGTLGYFQRRVDDCLQASVATLVQLPMCDIPDIHLDRQIREGKDLAAIQQNLTRDYEDWSQRHGYTITTHTSPTRTAERWIGVIETGIEWNDHCLVMSKSECIWDVLRMFPPRKHERMMHATESNFTEDDIDYSITIERTQG
jgi:hypothetical protein